MRHYFLLCAMFCLGAQLLARAASDRCFRIRGELTYRVLGEDGEQAFILHKGYSVLVSPGFYNITSTNTIPSEDPENRILYHEAGTDAESSFCVASFSERSATSRRLPKASVTAESNVISVPITATIRNGIIPTFHTEPMSGIAVIWLAYASGAVLKQKPTSLPAIWPTGLPDEPMRTQMLRVDYTVIDSSWCFLSELRFYSEGAFWMRIRGKEQRMSFPSPFHKGFLNARFSVLQFTDVDGVSVPGDFKFVKFSFRKGATSTNDVYISSEWLGTAAEIERAVPPTSFTPVLAGNAAVFDYREDELKANAYLITNHTWIPKNSREYSRVLNHAKEIERAARRTASNETRNKAIFTAALVLAFIAGVFGIVVKIRQLEDRNKKA